MPMIMKQVMPAGVPLSMLDAVTEEMGVDSNPPAGMLVHTHYEQDGQAHILDVWETAEAHQNFVESRLMPAMAKVAEAQGFDIAAAGPPETVFTEVHRAVRGA
ncbi:MAG: hypothetical protein QOE99_40 [Actinomycetota bacterium]|nr:hypothetical protein [Actinomycetota bacterium]